MIEGIGIDIVEVQRMENVIRRQTRFSKRILTENERRVYETLKPGRKMEFLVGRFAAKEAYAKAAGTGIGKFLSWQDIEILTDEMGKPFMTVKVSTSHIHVSISHTRKYAAAQVVIESE